MNYKLCEILEQQQQKKRTIYVYHLLDFTIYLRLTRQMKNFGKF